MKRSLHFRVLFFTVLMLLAGCASLKSAMQLSEIDFTFDRVSSVRIAGIDLMQVHSVEEINMFKVGRATLAASRGNLPLELTVHVKTENPLVNRIAATLVALDWTLVLDGRDTISGTINDRITLQAGKPQTIPLRLSLNLMEFFQDRKAMDLLELALAVAGEGGDMPQGVALKIRPTIETPLGAIRPGEMTIVPDKKQL